MASQSIGGKSSTRRVEKRVLIKELRTMLYGFGDVPVPRQDTVEVVEDCLFDFLTRFVTLLFYAVANAGFKGSQAPWREGSYGRSAYSP